MPELPEVETIINDLKRVILNKKIANIVIKKPKLIKNTLGTFRSNLLKSRIKDIRRLGKLIIIKIDSKKYPYLLIHLKMTGQLIYCSKNSVVAGGHSEQGDGKKTFRDICKPGKYTHIILKFGDGSVLHYNDLRQFGLLKLVSAKDLPDAIKNYGKDALDSKYSLSWFIDSLKKRKTSIKQLLLDQKILAGIGNIYADEILFRAGVRPFRKVNVLKKAEIEKIYKQIKPILKQAIKYRGTTFSDFVDSKGKKGNFSKLLNVYGRNNEQCLKCKKAKIIKIKLGGRGTHYCPNCQK